MRYKVPYINLPLQFSNLEKELKEVFGKVMSEGSFILRDDVRKFEENISQYLGCRFAVGVNSGTDALFLALYQYGFKPQEEVITVAHTFVATVATIVHCGLKPVLVDIGDDFLMDPGKVEGAITKKTRAIVPVHLNGRVCDMEKISNIAKKYKLAIIEDACQSLGADFSGKKAGTFGIGCFSLHPMKNLGGAGDGGFLATNDEDLAVKIKSLRNHGQKSKEEIVAFGFSSRLDNLQAAILNVKLKYLPGWIKRRRYIAEIYTQELKNIEGLRLPDFSQERNYDVYSSYCVRVDRRDALFEHLRKEGVEVFVHWPTPIHLQKGLQLAKFKLPKTEKVSETVLSLPVYPELTDSQVEFVINAVKKFFKK